MADISELGFNAAEVEPNAAFDVIPAGDYEAVIVASERKATANNLGEYIKLELQIVGGEYQNRKLWDNLNIRSHGANKEVTEKIAKGTLSAICRAVGVLTPKDTSELHMKKVRIKVGVQKRNDTGENQNRIKAYEPVNAGPPLQTASVAGGSAIGATPW